MNPSSVEKENCAHLSPLKWEHINLTGDDVILQQGGSVPLGRAVLGGQEHKLTDVFSTPDISICRCCLGSGELARWSAIINISRETSDCPPAAFATIVKLSGGNIGVAEPFLDLGYIGLMVERVRGRGGAQRMNTEPVHLGADASLETAAIWKFCTASLSPRGRERGEQE